MKPGTSRTDTEQRCSEWASGWTAQGGDPPLAHLPSSSHAPTLNDLNQKNDDRQDEQDMDESAQGVRANQPQYPQDKQYDSNGPQHFASPVSCMTGGV
jgi:hypothetical protein